jgi:glycosyl transferase family 1
MNVFLWHVHGSWTTAFVEGPHRYFVPVLPGRGPDGRGRAQTWDWPVSVIEVDPLAARELDVDVVVLQRPVELHHLAATWLGGRAPGRDVPAVYVEHNAPTGPAAASQHPVADRDDVPVVHVTHFNELMWDNGVARSVVIEHGIVDPGSQYSGELPRAAAVINEPVRRSRVAGTDLLPRFEAAVPVDLFGMGADALGGIDDLPQEKLHRELARRRVYVHPFRWTSLGLTLLEAMALGMPVVAVASTAAIEAVPSDGGVLSTDVSDLVDAVAELVADRDAATETGARAREHVLGRYGLDRFLHEWDRLMREVIA